MSTVDDLNVALRRLGAQYEAKKEENRQIEQKISALEESKRIMNQAKRSAEDLRNSIAAQKVDGWWNGKLANRVTDRFQDSKNKMNSVVIAGIDEAIGTIDSHIFNLRLQYDYIVGLMSNIENSMIGKRNELRVAQAELSANNTNG